MTTSARLFTLPPDQAGSGNRHKEALGTARAKSLRANVLAAATAVTDSLVDGTGAGLVSDTALSFDRSASQATPGPGKGRLWVKDDGSPYTLQFTNDAGEDLALAPTLENVLVTSTDADALGAGNVGKLTFDASSAVLIGTESGAAVGTNTSTVAVGQAASTGGVAGSTAIGAATSTTLADSTIVGYNSSVVSEAPDNNELGGVVLGSQITSKGRATCIGYNITQSAENDATGGESILIGRDITLAAGNNAVVGVGDGVTVGAAGVTVVGTGASATGANSVVLGHNASGTAANVVSVGRDASASGAFSTVVGRLASATASHATALGYKASATGSAALAVGAYTVSSGSRSIAIGGGTSEGDGATASADNAIAIGSGTTASHSGAICIGADLESRVANEVGGRGFKILHATATTTDGTATQILTFPTVLGDVIHADLAVTAYNTTDDQTYAASLTNQHFRFKSAGLSKSAGIGSTLEDNSETGSFATTITAVASNIVVTISGAAGKTVNWSATLRLYCTPLA